MIIADLAVNRLRKARELAREAGVEAKRDAMVAGEAWNLTLSEWMRYHELVADANAGRMHLATIILDPSARQALEKIEFTRTLGFEVAEVDMSEISKTGGGIHCMAQALRREET